MMASQRGAKRDGVSRRDSLGGASPYDRGDRRGVSRRTLLCVIGGCVGLAALGAAGGLLLAGMRRSVALTVNGAACEVPEGSTSGEIISRGLASPSAGNLVSISTQDQPPEVLEVGAGMPYRLMVNGAQVDPASYLATEGDVLEFVDGEDVTEDVEVQTTEIPYGALVPESGKFLVKIGYVAQWGRPGISEVATGVVSGRVVDRGVTQQPQDFIIACAEHITPADGRRLIALTFDDGPDLTYTPQYLDILASYGARATFFNLGSQVDAGPEYAALSKRCVDEGHQVASHTYSHLNLLLTSDDEVASDLSRSFEAIANATGVSTNVMRPPFGNFYGDTFLAYLRNGGDIAYSAYWGIDSLDWDLVDKTGISDGAAQIIQNCTQGIEKDPDDYSGGIVLMHDSGGNRDRDVAALPGLIETFQSYGFELVTLNELLSACNAFPEWVTSGFAARPEGACVPDESAEITYYDPNAFNPLESL